MKKIIFRKLLSDWIVFFLITLFISSVIVWIVQAINFLDLVLDGRDYWIYIYFSLLNFPKILTKIIPFILFFSLFYILVRNEEKNELSIFWYHGVKKINVINFFFKISLLLFLIQIFLSTYIVPYSLNKGRLLLKNSNINYFESFIKSKKFNDTLKGLTLYSENQDPNGDLHNLYIKKDNDNEFQITYAKKGIFKIINNIPILVLFDGETISTNNNQITNFSFSKSDLILKNHDINATTYTKNQEILTKNLLMCLNKIYELNFFKKKAENFNQENCSESNKVNLLIEFYKRLIMPLYIPILSIVPFILIISSKVNSNYFKIKILTFLIGLSIVIFSETTTKLISVNIIKNIQILIIPLFLLIIFYSIFFLNFRNLFKNKI
ncbi:MAG: LptF/LptG family permease [Alphaproteobacteria bacterium]|nr:LptF/LptG family permease [Alphaproteobacteria bacterium]